MKTKMIIASLIACMVSVGATEVEICEPILETDYEVSSVTQNEPKVRHDSMSQDMLHRECKFIIEECYTSVGKDTFHYIDEYVRNIDHSISFIGEDGKVVTIPYPYFRIIVNDRTHV